MALGKKLRSSNVSQTYLFSLTQRLLRKTFLALSYNRFYSIGIYEIIEYSFIQEQKKKEHIFHVLSIFPYNFIFHEVVITFIFHKVVILLSAL